MARPISDVFVAPLQLLMGTITPPCFRARSRRDLCEAAVVDEPSSIYTQPPSVT